mmetsp:Transcript_151354/g.367652  ORF Transcript_151354/g.367652 Transcript_151354/m.367652 type:complete len:321 (+) Transcript_151354:85-1047(+)
MAHSPFHCLLTPGAEMHRENQIAICCMAYSPRDSSQIQRAEMHQEIQLTEEPLTVSLGPEGSELEGDFTNVDELQAPRGRQACRGYQRSLRTRRRSRRGRRRTGRWKTRACRGSLAAEVEGSRSTGKRLRCVLGGGRGATRWLALPVIAVSCQGRLAGEKLFFQPEGLKAWFSPGWCCRSWRKQSRAASLGGAGPFVQEVPGNRGTLNILEDIDGEGGPFESVDYGFFDVSRLMRDESRFILVDAVVGCVCAASMSISGGTAALQHGIEKGCGKHRAAAFQAVAADKKRMKRRLPSGRLRRNGIPADERREVKRRTDWPR